eukprot:gene13123-3443_t
MNKRTQDRPLYILLMQRFLSSGVRVANPEDADWFFFLPLYLNSMADNELLEEAIEYISSTWPY